MTETRAAPGPTSTEAPDLVSPGVAHLADRLRPATPPEKPLKIFFWPADMVSGCFTYRIEIIGQELARQGHEVVVSQRMTPWAREEADIIVGQRVAPLKPSAMWQLICAERNRNGKGGMVYEADDDLFNIDHTNPMGELFRIPAIRKNIIDNVKAANLVTVSTQPLADVMAQFNGNTAVLANCVRTEAYSTPAPLRRGKPDGMTIYGWQGSPTHAEDWQVCRQAVIDTLAADEGARMKFLGTPYWDGMPRGTNQVSYMGWQTDIAKHYKRVGRFDVSLAPLTGSTFNRSKSGLRAQESLALGVPVVASDVPAYRAVVEHGVTGLLVRTHREWMAAMAELRNPALRLTMGAAGRHAALAWSIERRAADWIAAYRSIL